MKIASAKAKGRRASSELREELLKHTDLSPDDIQVTPSSVTGKDLWLSPKAKSKIPLVFEVKNQESLNIWDAYKQAESHWEAEISKEEVYPAVVYRRNRSDPMITMSLEDFLHLLFIRGKHVQKEETEESRDIHLP